MRAATPAPAGFSVPGSSASAGTSFTSLTPAGRARLGMTRALSMLRDSLVESQRLEQERQRAEAEMRRAQAQLGEAIEAISEGFVLYDADDRLVICNHRFKEMYADVALEIEPGTQYETILRATAGMGIIPAASDKGDAWVAERLDRHRNPEIEIVEHTVKDGYAAG